MKRELARREWSQADLARRMDRPPMSASNWVRGARVPDPASCADLADVLGVSYSLGMDRAGHPIEQVIEDEREEALVGSWRQLTRHNRMMSLRSSNSC